MQYAFPLNVISKFLACISVVSLLKTAAPAKSVADINLDEDAKHEISLPELDSEPMIKGSGSVPKDEAADRAIRQATLGTHSARHRFSGKSSPASHGHAQSQEVSLAPVVSCQRCGRSIARDDRYCDRCGLPMTR